MPDPRVLVVEDDPPMQRLLRTQLETRGFNVTLAATGREAILELGDNVFDVVLLDIGLPDTSGIELCRTAREWSTVPIILVTAADIPQTKIQALELGADDYMTKPFHMGELVARMRAVLRRANAETTRTATTIQAGDVRVDIAARRAWCRDEEVKLTRTEFDLLHELVRQPDRVLTHQQLLEAVWGPGYDDVRSVHVHVCNLRRKLERGPTGPRRILAVQGVGYRFRISDDGG